MNIEAASVPDWQLTEWMTPFWKSTVMHNEPVLMWASEGKRPEAPLLFDAEEILSVRDSGLETVYQKGSDWNYEKGVLAVLPESRIPWMSESQLYPGVESNATKPRIGGGLLLFQEGGFFHKRQIVITYRHKPVEWTTPVPAFDPAILPETIRKLRSRQKVKIMAYGDSITEGVNASAMSQLPPFQPNWVSLVGLWLQHIYRTPVVVVNRGLGGKNTDWGLQNASEYFGSERPDLAIIAFGMNDRKLAPEEFLERIKGIMAAARRSNSEVEFILVQSMRPNPEWTSLGNLEVFGDVLRGLSGPGVGFVDMTSMHGALLKRKRYVDLTGNHVNHPNDFLIRIYAQLVASVCSITVGSPATRKPL